MVVPPDDDRDLADDVRSRNGAPCPAVAGVAPAVAHHEVLAAGNPGGRHVGGRLVTDAGELRQPRLGQRLPVDQDGVPDEEIVSPGSPITRLTRSAYSVS